MYDRNRGAEKTEALCVVFLYGTRRTDESSPETERRAHAADQEWAAVTITRKHQAKPWDKSQGAAESTP
jgi:hypothetical protein